MSPGLEVGAQCVSADLTYKATHRASEHGRLLSAYMGRI